MTVGRISANGLQRKILSSLALKITDNDFKYSGYQKQRKPSHKEKKNHNVCGKAETKNNKNTFIRTLVLK